MNILIYSDNTPKSALKNIADDLVFYLSKFNFIVHLTRPNMKIDEVLSYDFIIGLPDIYFSYEFDKASDQQRKELNKKCVPIFHFDPLTNLPCFKHRFLHGIWTTELGYINREMGKQIDKFETTYNKVYLPIGVNTDKFYPTRKISKIKRIGFVGNIDNINKPDAQCWVSNKRPQLFLDIAEAANLEWVSISNREHNVHMYDDVDLVICTSISEGNPMGLLESTACKIPFISTPCGIVNEYTSIKTFNTVEEAISIIQELNSSDDILTKYISDVYHEILPDRDWSNIIIKYWIPEIVKKINIQSHYDFIEIGTSDFSTLLQEYPNKKGISIEPIQVYYESLPTPITGVKINCAIADYDGEVIMNWVHPDDIKERNLPDWLRGCNSMGSHIHRDKFSNEVLRKSTVKCITWDTLVKTYDILSVGIIKIDTEGYDHMILAQIFHDCKNRPFRPNQIIFENNELANKKEIEKLVNEFILLGYSYTDGYDSILKYKDYE
jgi:FkbM family methyltransferase